MLKVLAGWAAMMTLFFGTPTVPTVPTVPVLGAVCSGVTIDGNKICLDFTDDNTNENLIIKSDKKDYYGFGITNTYFSITNNSGQGQFVRIAFSQKNEPNNELVSLKEFNGETIKVIPASFTKRDTNTLIAATATPAYYETGIIIEPEKEVITSKWKDVITQTFDRKNPNRKSIGDRVTEKESTSIYIGAGETKYFNEKHTYTATLGQPEEFFLEAFGNMGAYGHLDPNDWIATAPLDVGPDAADIVGTGDGTGWSGNWVNTSEGTKWDYDSGVTPAQGTFSSISAAAGNDSITVSRSLTTAVDAGIISMQVRMAAQPTTGQFQLFLNNTANGGKWAVRWDSTGILLRGGTNVTILGTPAVDTWYKVHVSFDSTGNAAKARLDTDTAWTATVTALNTGNVDRFQIMYATAVGQTTAAFLDDIAVGCDPPSPCGAVLIPSDMWFWFLWGT